MASSSVDSQIYFVGNQKYFYIFVLLLILLHQYLSTSTSDLHSSHESKTANERRQRRVGTTRETSSPTEAGVTRRSHFTEEKKAPAEMNVLLYMFQSRFQIPSCVFFFLFFQLCKHSCSYCNLRCAEIAASYLPKPMIGSSHRSSWPLPGGADLGRSSVSPHQGAEALQILCVNFYGKCLRKVRHIDFHLSFL